MSKKPIRISANEVNRFTYCPYQWYYGRVYGQKTLKEKYQALDKGEGQHEANFKKGLHFHEHYYKSYRMKRRIEIAIFLIFLILVTGGLVKWFM